MIYVYGIYKKLTQIDFSIVRVVMNGVLPLSLGIMLIYVHADNPNSMSWYHYLFGGLYAFSPFILFLSGFKGINIGIVAKIFVLYKRYSVSFLIGLAIFVIFFCIGEAISEFRYSRISELIWIMFIFTCCYSFGVWFILMYAWIEIEDTLTEINSKNILKTGVIIAFVFLIIWMSPNWKDSFIKNRITTAQTILSKNGETRD